MEELYCKDQPDDVLLNDVSSKSQVWMSHADTILDLACRF